MTREDVIAIAFDFDDTLGPDSTSGLLNAIGVDVHKFWNDLEIMSSEHWDPVPAYLYKIIKLNQALPQDKALTKQSLVEWGKKAPLYPGVDTIFSYLRSLAKELNPHITLEFYIISSGIEEVIRASPIASNFTDIWACDFCYDESGRLAFPKRIVSFTDKTRYLFHISKGLIGDEVRQKPFEVNRKFDSAKKRISMDQIIFVGDGYTDIPCFSLIRKAGGIPIAVCDTEDRKTWGKAWGFMEEKRVTHWAVADYQEGSTLRASLSMAIATIIRRLKK